mgnify:CR=1 FL=1
MNKEFVPYEQALELKELGFNEICLTFYNYDKKLEIGDDWAYGIDYESKRDRNECLAPLYQQAFRWFREKYESTIHIYQYQDTQRWDFDIYDNIPEERDFGNPSYNTYEEAELACLKKLIEIVKNK